MNSGFTLIEVMVALVIFAVVSTALAKSAGTSLRQTGQLEAAAVAAWLAENQLARLRIAPRTLGAGFPAIGQSRQRLTAASREWEVETRIEASEHDGIRRAIVAVYADGDLQAGRPAQARLAGFIGRH